MPEIFCGEVMSERVEVACIFFVVIVSGRLANVLCWYCLINWLGLVII